MEGRLRLYLGIEILIESVCSVYNIVGVRRMCEGVFRRAAVG